jgi:hypothetical protein
MPPLEQADATIVLPTIVQTTMQAPTKSVVAPGGGAPPSALSRLDPEVGGTVLTPFGLARVLQVRSRGVVKCQLKGSSQGAKALCILNESTYQVLSQVATSDMSPVELAQYALRLQTHALAEAKQHHSGRALQLYERVLAVSSQLLQQRASMPQSQRGDWVIRTVKCSIEAARVAIQLHLFPLALDYTKDALGVIDALDRKRAAAATADGTSPPASPVRKPSSAPANGSTKDEDTSVTSTSDSSSVTSSSTSSTAPGGDLQDLGCVKLFGECRVKALLLTAQSLLEMRSGGKTLAFAALKLLDQAQTIMRKFSTRQYLENREYRSTLKVFVSLQKDLKRLKKQAKLIIKPKAPAVEKAASPGRFTSFFRLRRVMFADDNDSSNKAKARTPSPVVAVVSKAVAAVVATSSSSSESSSTWTRRDTLVLGGVVAGGLVAFHCVMRRHRV